MTDVGHVRTRAGAPSTTEPERSGWTGWVVFAAFMAFLLGTFQIVDRVTASGLVISVDYTAWGWTHLLLGVVIVAGGVGVLAGNLIARVLGVALAGISAVLTCCSSRPTPCGASSWSPSTSW
jgi:hypothetical protein